MRKPATAPKQKVTRAPAVAATGADATTAATQPKKATRPARKAKAAKPTAKKAGSKVTAAKTSTTKKDQVVAMISRAKGATLDEIMATMGWQRHTVRGFVSLLGKAGTKIESSKSDAGVRTYKAA